MERTTQQATGEAIPEVPVVCSPQVLSKAERAAHFDLCVDALVRRPLERLELPDGYLFQYEGDEQVFLLLARWAATEHRCCPWASYSVEMSPFGGTAGRIRLRVTATDEGKQFLTVAYRYLEELRGEIPPESVFDARELTRGGLLERLKEMCKC